MLKQEAKRSRVTLGIGGDPALPQEDLFGQLERQGRAVEPGRARIENRGGPTPKVRTIERSDCRFGPRNRERPALELAAEGQFRAIPEPAPDAAGN